MIKFYLKELSLNYDKIWFILILMYCIFFKKKSFSKILKNFRYNGLEEIFSLLYERLDSETDLIDALIE